MVKGVIVTYVNVGQLPHEKVQGYLEQIKSPMGKMVEELESEGYRFMFIPVRNDDTRVEILPLG